MSDAVADAGGHEAAEDAVQIPEAAVQKTRAWTGLFVVVGGDVAIALAAVLGIVVTSGAGSDQVVAILTSAFTAISSMTSAYFGIRAASNTAQSSVQGTVRAAEAARTRRPLEGPVASAGPS
jgi:hypothetical protein